MIEMLTMAVLAQLASPPPAILSIMPGLTAADGEQAEKAVEKIIADYRAEEQTFYKKLDEAESEEEQQKIFQMGGPDPTSHFEAMHTIAKDNAKTEAAAKAASWVVSMSGRGGPDDGSSDWALDMLLSDFMDTEHIATVTQMCGGMSTRDVTALERIREETSNERAMALADYYRASQLIMLGKAAQEFAEAGSSGDPYMSYHMQGIDDELKSKLKSSDAEKLKAKGEKLFEHCKKKYADVELYPESGLMVAAKAEGALFEMHNLQIGSLAPDIEGVDAEGIAFNLYDYRGQVLILDFWGFW